MVHVDAITTSVDWATGDVYLDANGDRQPQYWLLDVSGKDKFHRALSTEITLENGELSTVRHVTSTVHLDVIHVGMDASMQQ